MNPRSSKRRHLKLLLPGSDGVPFVDQTSIGDDYSSFETKPIEYGRPVLNAGVLNRKRSVGGLCI